LIAKQSILPVAKTGGGTGMACETVDTTANDADILVLSDVARIALRRNFENGKVISDDEVTPSLLGKVG
jgi:hypothetical protein